jgi:hypothetical protein
LITLWFPRFLRKFKSFFDSIESIDSIIPICCDIFYHKSITLQSIPPHFPLFQNSISGSPDFESLLLRTGCSFYKFIPMENLRVLDAARLDELFDHMGKDGSGLSGCHTSQRRGTAKILPENTA